jgi:hypothetical protein
MGLISFPHLLLNFLGFEVFSVVCRVPVLNFSRRRLQIVAHAIEELVLYRCLCSKRSSFQTRHICFRYMCAASWSPVISSRHR